MALIIPPKPLLFLLLLSLSSLITTTTSAEPQTQHKFIKTIPASKQTTLRQKTSHLHFYFHDIVSGPNATAVRITDPPSNYTSRSFFGWINMMDDPLTEGPDPNSVQVGRAQGLYASACLQEIGFLQAMNLCFTQGKYNGSVLTVMGRNAPLHPVREMPVVGGSGLFRFATGFALARTHWINMRTGDAVVEYNVTVMHY